MRRSIMLIILIGIIIVLGSVLAFVTIASFDKSSTESFSNLSPQLQGILDYCEEVKTGNDMNLIGLSYYNDTHYIDNHKCEWRLLENYPDTNLQCIPGQHHYTNDDVIPMNRTHTFDNDKCEWVKTFSWEEEWDEKFQSTTSSYMEKVVPTLDDFKKFTSNSPDIDTIFSRFGEPMDDIGSGIHIYIYELDDLTEIWIGYADDIVYVKHIDSNGNELEELFTKNKNPERCSGYELCVSGKMYEIIDGDTIRVHGGDNFLFLASFALAFAPELDEYGGEEARQFIEMICPIDSDVLVDQDHLQGLDRSLGMYSSMVLGEVYCNGVNLNEALVESEYGHIGIGYCKNSEFSDSDWAKKHGC